MSLPSIAKEKTSNKVSLVARPSVTLVQPVQVIGSSAPKSTVIYVQSIKPSTSQLTYIATTVNKTKSSIQPVTIAPKPNPRPPTFKRFVTIPSTSTTNSSVPNRLQQLQLNTTNIVTISNSKKPTFVGQQCVVKQQPFATTQIKLNDKQAITKIVKTSKVSTLPQSQPQPQPLPPNQPIGHNHKTSTVVKLDPIKNRYRTILENLLQLKNNFIRRTITQAIQQKLANQSNEDLLNVIFKSFELTLLSVNIEQIYLNVSLE